MLKDSNQKGFTLLEVMVALSIIVIVLTALIGTQSQGMSMAIESKFNTTAALLARDKMSRLEIVPDDEISSDSGDFGDDFASYGWTLEVEPLHIPGVEEADGRLLRLDLVVFLKDDDKFQYDKKE